MPVDAGERDQFGRFRPSNKTQRVPTGRGRVSQVATRVIAAHIHGGADAETDRQDSAVMNPRLAQ